MDVDFVYKLTKDFPSSEKFGLVSQMQRAAVSVPSNVAEGFARQYEKEFKRFCFIALGSCAELETLLMIGKSQGYVTEGDVERLEEMLDHESRMLMNLSKKLDS